MQDGQHEQRDSQRVVVNHEFDSVEAFLTEYVTNISRSGIFIRSQSLLAVGTRVHLRFTLLLDEIEVIEGVGEVTRVQSDLGRPAGMGVAFVELTPDSERVVERLLHAYRRESPPRIEEGP